MSDVTLVLRTRTNLPELWPLLDGIAAQRLKPRRIVVVDSGSSADVLARLYVAVVAGWERIPLKLIEIEPSTYGSAHALNVGMQAVETPLAAVLSQDAQPAGDDYLEALASAMEDQGRAGCYGRQVPRGDCDPWTARDLEATYGPESRDQSAPDCWFVNTCSMIRRELWERYPFDEQAGIVEDHAWARDVQHAGYRVGYVAEAVVRHHHDHRELAVLWQRFRNEGAGLRQVHGRGTGVWAALSGSAKEAGRDVAMLAKRGELKRAPRAALRRAVKHGALYWGGRREDQP